MSEMTVDPNDLLRQYDSVSRSQRSLFAEFERQRSRLIQLVRWYDHQQSARGSELRREFEQVNKESRRQIYHRSQIVMKERSRLKHILDPDVQQLRVRNSSKPLSPARNHSNDRKRRAYGCLLPEFKAPLRKYQDDWLRSKCHSSITLTEFQKHRDAELQQQEQQQQEQEQQHRRKKPHHHPSTGEQRHRIEHLLDKCRSDLEYDDGDGYDHFLQTSQPQRNAQILAQQLIHEKTLYPIRQKQQ